MVLFFTHIPFVVNHTFNATPPERLQQYQHSRNSNQNAVPAIILLPERRAVPAYFHLCTDLFEGLNFEQSFFKTVF